MEDPITIHSGGHFQSSFFDRSLPTPRDHSSSYIRRQHSSLTKSFDTHFSPSPQTRTPPSPPDERMQGFNLPPITDLLKISRGDQVEQRNQPSSHTQSQHAPSPQHHQIFKKNDPLPNAPPNGGSFLLPPTPPLQPVKNVPQQLHNPPHKSASQLLPPPPTTTFPSHFQTLDSHAGQHESHYTRHTSLPTPLTRQRSSYPAASSHSVGSSSLHGSPQVSHNSRGSVSNQSHPRHQSMPGLITQQPLPTDFPPHIPKQLPTPHSSISAGSSNDVSASSSAHTSWQSQHHTHMSPTTPHSAGPFSTSQDRYVCPTCTKAFSRPSSLRIHSHSHTGEKPFKCPHKGCGKAFSVRSNMKRHERGCHAERAMQSEVASIAAAVAAAGGRDLLPAT